VNRLDELLGRRVSLRALVVLRVFAGVIAALYLWPFANDARHGFVYRDAFHEPYASWYPELPRSLYVALLWVGLFAALAMAAGIATRVTTVTTAAIVAYNQFLSTTNYHNNRAYLLIVLAVLAVAPCGWRAGGDGARAPAWPLWLLRFEASVVYGASGLSKLLDPDWFGGTVTYDRVLHGAADLRRSVLPGPVVDVLLDRSFQGIAAKVVVATECFVALGLWSRRTRYAAVWLAVCFHVAIETSASVEVFSYLGIAALLVWAVPSVRDRTLVLDPAIGAHRAIRRAVRALDWLGRFAVVEEEDTGITVIDRDGTRRTGGAAVVFVASRLPLTAWFALPALLLPGNRGEPAAPRRPVPRSLRCAS
jgi:hypothetical protein